jgi:hypothetical protein
MDYSSNMSSEERSRYIRINPDIRQEPPKLDAVNQIAQLENATKRALQRDRLIEDVAHRLVASTFYFRSISLPSPNPPLGGVFGCRGTIPLPRVLRYRC